MAGIEWTEWNNNSIDCTYSSTSGDTSSWYTWNSIYNGTSSDVITWKYWVYTNNANNGTTTIDDYGQSPFVTWIGKQEETQEQKKVCLQKQEEERRIYAEQQEVFRKAQEELQAKQKLADEKAMETLMELLDEGQQAMLKKDGTFVVMGEKSNKKYRVKPGTMVDVLEEGEAKPKERLCFQPVNPKLSKFDYAISQMLMLKWSEEAVLKMANRYHAY